MSALSAVLRQCEGGTLMFWCPGCKEAHSVKPGIWTWDGNSEQPTFSPSVLVRGGHYVDGKRPCWCDYEKEHPGESPFKCSQCHSFVTNGMIQFLTDSTHALAGQTVPLPPWPPGE